ncbi:hypothetical protein Bca52824_044342 [Brassica carinata]|uniref:Uncharacterized protein n=1 Tax=Brassica carinata TaxID=52824 RepID=A0A8X7S0P7_BRACI|nr:hypothetical protein Bca52824_044342 [Brassica carinata]
MENHEAYENTICKKLRSVAMIDGGEEPSRKLEEKKRVWWEEVRRQRMAIWAAKNGSGFRFLWKKYLTDTGQKLHSSFSTATSGVITLSVGSLFSWGLYKLNNKVYDVTSIFKKNEFWNDKLAILSKLPTTLSELQSDVLSLKEMSFFSKRWLDFSPPSK